jgi:hypothetical protein
MNSLSSRSNVVAIPIYREEFPENVVPICQLIEKSDVALLDPIGSTIEETA